MDLPIPGFIIRGALATASALGGIVSPMLVDRKRIERIRDIAYGDRDEQVLDLYRPRTRSGKLPVALLVHGGGFRYFSKNTHAAAAARLAETGRLVLCIDYRLTPKNPFPAGLVDTIFAYDWLTKHAEAYGGELDRISLLGESSGANFVVALSLYLFGLAALDSKTILPELPTTKPKAIVAHCGYFEVIDIGRFDGDKRCHAVARRRVKLIRGSYLPEFRSERKPAWALADPYLPLREMGRRGQSLPKGFPEVFIPVGALDPVIGDSERFAAVMADLGQADRLKVYPEVGHAFYASPAGEQSNRCWADIATFLDRSNA